MGQKEGQGAGKYGKLHWPWLFRGILTGRLEDMFKNMSMNNLYAYFSCVKHGQAIL